MAATLDPAYEAWMKTPSILTAGITADNPFEDSFGSTMQDSPANMYNEDLHSMYDRSMTRGFQHDDGFNFGQGRALSQLPQSLTPPLSAKSSPSHWQFQEMKQNDIYCSPPLQTIDTSSSRVSDSKLARMEHGQATPPDDEMLIGGNFQSTSAQAVAVKQEAQTPLSASASASKRKSVGNATQPDEQPGTGPKRRRPRKTRSMSKVSIPPPEEPVEYEKRSKFLERNRVAASKCRQKKKEWTQNLESKARELQAENKSLSILVASLKDEVLYLRGEMLKHTDCGCDHIREYLAREAENIANGGRSPGIRVPYQATAISRHNSDFISRPSTSSTSRTAPSVPQSPLKSAITPLNANGGSSGDFPEEVVA